MATIATYGGISVPTMILYLVVRNAADTIRFYEKAFGFAWINSKEAKIEEIQHVEMRYKDTLLMFAPEGAFDSPLKAPVTLGMESLP